MTAQENSNNRQQPRQPPFEPTSEPVVRAGRETAAQVRAHITRSFYSDPPILVVSMCDPWCENDVGGDYGSYIERVKAIDSIISTRRRFYIVFDFDPDHVSSITIRAENIWVLNAWIADPMATAVVQALLDLGANVYVHSVCAMKSHSVQELLSKRSGRLLLDLHDGGPEEVGLQEGAEDLARAREYHRRTAEPFDQLICTTERVIAGYIVSYGELKNNALIYPVVLEADPSDVRARTYNERPKFLWVAGGLGGTETPNMVDVIKRIQQFADCLILTPTVQRTKMEFIAQGLQFDRLQLTIGSTSRNNLINCYQQCDFGLLPSRSILCDWPDLLVEYLAVGVVPIIDASQNADYNPHGVHYVSLEHALRGDWPTCNKRRMMATANFSIFQKTNACRSEILNALTPNTTRYTKLEILSDKGFLVLKDYIGPSISDREWLSLQYLNWKSGGDTNFAPIASAYGEMECAGFWDHGKADKDGVWTENAKKCPTLVAWSQSVGANFGRVRIVKLNPSTETEAIRNLHRDNNNALNPPGEGWIVRVWLQLTHDPSSQMILREGKDDCSSDYRIELPRNRQIIIDSQRLFHAVWHRGPEPRYALIASFESGAALNKWIERQLA